MKLVQYNIYFGNCLNVNIETRLENICKYLIAEDADVVCLQEVLQNMYELIVNMLIKKYPYPYPEPCEGLKINYGTVIFSKYQIKKAIKHKFEFTAMGRDMKLIMIQNSDQEQIYICTTHFESEFNGECLNKLLLYIVLFI